MKPKNIKLRGVELDSFRGFRDHVKFDFVTPKGEIANLVAIFAPNGFGKTSFFEGVEWSVKGTIERFEDNSTIRNAAEEEGGDILKNRDSKEKHGRVRLIDSEGAFFERRTSSSKKWDLLPGIPFNKSTSKIYEGLKSVNINKQIEILPQSRIDSFLSSKTPQQKYDALLDFWGGKDDSAYFVGLSKLLEYTKADIETINAAVLDLSNEVAGIEKSENRTALFNSLIKQINNSKLFDKNLNGFSDSTSERDLKETTNDINHKLADAESRLKNEKDREEKFIGLENAIDIYFQDIPLSKSMADQLEKLRKSVLDYNEQQKRIKEKSSTEREIVLKQKEMEVLNRVASLQQEFKEIQMRLEGYLKERQELTLLVQRGSSANKDAIARLGKANTALKKLTENEETFLQNQGKLKDLNKRTFENTQRIGPSEIRLSTAKKIRAIYDDSAQRFWKDIQLIQNIYNQPLDLFVNMEFTFSMFARPAALIKDLFLKNQELKREYAEAERNFSKIGSLDENLQKLIQFGLQHVNGTHTDTCPLCQTKQNDFSTLITLIENQKKDILGIGALTIELESLRKQMDVQQLHIFEEYKNLTDALKNYEQTLITQLQLVEKKSVAASGYNQYYESIISLAIAENNRLLEQIQVLNKNNDILAQQVKNNQEQRIDLNNQIKELNDLIHTNQTKMDDDEANIREIDSKTKTENSNPTYVEVRAYLTLNKQLEAEFIQNGLSYKIKDIDEQLDLLEKKNHEQIEQLGLLIKRNVPVDIIQTNREIERNTKDLASLLEKITTYQSQFEAITGSKLIGKSELKKGSVNNKTAVRLLQECLVKLRELQENIKFMQANLLLNGKKHQLKKYQDDLNSLIASETNLTEMKQKVSNFLSAKINSVFNQKTINDIYQKIDPHPDLKEIKLVPEFTDVKPKLNILAVDGEGLNPVNPTLYLSSAQITILSLSIFLAKALQNSDTLINTIFMDDPIQYLDSINVLSFIDLIRSITTDEKIDRQIVISTHDENFFRLLKRKFDPDYYQSKFIKFDSYGKLES